jgi:K+-transporting ATPase ATPase C chain
MFEPIRARFASSCSRKGISPAAALYQVPRVARAHGLSEDQVQALVAKFTEGRQFGILGEPRVNVLKLNLALDETR